MGGTRSPDARPRGPEQEDEPEWKKRLGEFKSQIDDLRNKLPETAGKEYKDLKEAIKEFQLTNSDYQNYLAIVEKKKAFQSEADVINFNTIQDFHDFFSQTKEALRQRWFKEQVSKQLQSDFDKTHDAAENGLQKIKNHLLPPLEKKLHGIAIPSSRTILFEDWKVIAERSCYEGKKVREVWESICGQLRSPNTFNIQDVVVKLGNLGYVIDRFIIDKDSKETRLKR